MTILQFSLTMLAAQFSPGPDMILLLKAAVNHPLRAGLLTVVGIVCGLAVHCAIAALGLGAMLQANPMIFRGMLLVGAIYLGWLGVKLLLSLRAKPEEISLSGNHERAMSDKAAFLQGFITNITNAKAFLFLTSFIASGLSHDTSAGRKWILVAIILGQALFFWSLLVWLLKRRAIRQWYQRAERALNGIFGILLLTIAVQMALSAR